MENRQKRMTCCFQFESIEAKVAVVVYGFGYLDDPERLWLLSFIHV